MPRLLALLWLLALLPAAAAQQRTPLADEPAAAPGAAERGEDVVADGSFEAGRVPDFWRQQAFPFDTPLCTLPICDADMNSGAAPRTGDWFAWFGGANRQFFQSGLVGQDVTLPTPTATLSFWLRIPTLSAPHGGSFEVRLGDTVELNTDSVLVTLSYDDQPDFDAYSKVTVPIRSTGVPQRLSFDYTAFEDGVVFYLDDVSIGPPVPGGLATVAADTFAVGDVQLDETTVRALPVRNLGGDPLTLTDVVYSGDPGVTVASLPEAIAPGDVGFVEVRLAPEALGASQGELRIEGNGPDESVLVTWTAISTTVRSFCAAVPVDIPAAGTLDGPGSPYPSAITVEGIEGAVFDVDVRLVGLSHGLAQAIDLLVEHPLGPRTLVMSDVGAAGTFANATIILDDAAAEEMPRSVQVLPGRYRPTNHEPDDPFAPPAPPVPPLSVEPSLTVFDGLDPNGTWSLWAHNDFELFAGEEGRLSDWCLDIETTSPVSSETAPRTGLATLTVAPNPVRRAATVRFVPERSGGAVVALFDVTGRRLAVLHDGPVAEGTALTLSIDTGALPAGVYVVRAAGEAGAASRRVVVVR